MLKPLFVNDKIAIVCDKQQVLQVALSNNLKNQPVLHEHASNIDFHMSVCHRFASVAATGYLNQG